MNDGWWVVIAVLIPLCVVLVLLIQTWSRPRPTVDLETVWRPDTALPRDVPHAVTVYRLSTQCPAGAACRPLLALPPTPDTRVVWHHDGDGGTYWAVDNAADAALGYRQGVFGLWSTADGVWPQQVWASTASRATVRTLTGSGGTYAWPLQPTVPVPQAAAARAVAALEADAAARAAAVNELQNDWDTPTTEPLRAAWAAAVARATAWTGLDPPLDVYYGDLLEFATACPVREALSKHYVLDLTR